MVAETEAEMVEVTAVDPDTVGCNRTDEIDILDADYPHVRTTNSMSNSLRSSGAVC